MDWRHYNNKDYYDDVIEDFFEVGKKQWEKDPRNQDKKKRRFNKDDVPE